MRPFSSTLFSAIGITTLFACSASDSVTPQMPTSSIEGVVTDGTTGHPLRDAVVTLDGTDNLGDLTNQAGRFLLPDLPDGVYAVKVVILGYATQERQITVAAGQALVADFELEISAINLDHIVVTGVAGKVWNCLRRVLPHGTEKPVPGL